MKRHLIVFIVLLTSCARKPQITLPTAEVSEATTRTQITTPVKPDVEPITIKQPIRRSLTMAYPRPKLRVTFPGVQTVTPRTILQLRAAGLEGVEYVNADKAVWDEAQRVGFEIAVIYHDLDKSYVDFIAANHFPSGAWNIRDEPNPDVCPIVSTCYTQLQDIAQYAKSKSIPAAVILTAHAAFSPQGRWPTEAQPYYTIDGVEVMALDWYPYSWDASPLSQAVQTLSMLIGNTRQYGGLKPIVMYTDAGTFGTGSQRQSPVTADWIIADFNACWAAGAAVVSLFFIPDSNPPDPCNCSVRMGDDQWVEIVKAVDAITGPSSDANLDGVINLLDWQLAVESCNQALASRIAVAANLKRTPVPVVVKGS